MSRVLPASAAAARHFVSRRGPAFFPRLSSLSGALCVADETIVVNFVGLYDSVSSYGGEGHRTLIGQIIHNKLHKSFDDDVAELRLALGGEAKQVVQFAAADEYRQNFASTNIHSSVRANVGLEVLLPGVHSDIGGSYEEKKEERRYLLASERARLIKEGWYTADQLTLVAPGWYEGVRTLTHNFQFIPLALMVELAQQGHGEGCKPVTFKSFDDDKYQDYRVPADLQGLFAAMRTFVQGRPGPTREQPYAAAVFDLPDAYKPLRQKYLHRSAVKGELSTTGIAMAGRETKGLPDRQHIPDTADVH